MVSVSSHVPNSCLFEVIDVSPEGPDFLGVVHCFVGELADFDSDFFPSHVGP
jgi:hypothetical protein